MSLEDQDDNISDFLQDGIQAAKGISNIKVAQEVIKTGTAAGAAVRDLRLNNVPYRRMC